LDSWQAFDQVKRDALHETLTIGFTFGITTNLAKYLANTAQAGKHDCFTGVDNLVVVHIFLNDLKSRINLGQIAFQ